MTLKNSVRHVWRSFAGIYKCSKCLHFEKKYVVFFLFFYFGQILLQNVLCTTLLVENSTHQVILIPMSDLVCSLKYCNALLLHRWQLFSQGKLRLEFQEVIVFCFASCFWLFSCVFEYQRLPVTWRGELCLHSQPLIPLLNWLDSFHLTADRVILLLKRKFLQRSFLESKKIFDIVNFGRTNYW